MELCTQIGRAMFVEVSSRRYERGSTIVTSNLPFDGWASVSGSERLTGALLERLTHHLHILEMNRESYRLRQSKQRVRRSAASAGAWQRSSVVEQGTIIPLVWGSNPSATTN